MAISTMDGLLSALEAGKRTNIYKASATSKAAGSFHSLWTTAGFPTAGVAQGTTTGAIPTSLTTGAIPFTNPSALNSEYLARANFSQSTIGTLILYDRLWHSSALSGTSAVAQTFTMPALTRYTDGKTVELWAEWYTATGSTAVTATALYTNTADVSGRTATASFIASPVAGQMIAFTLQSGDLGIKSVQQITLSATTGTAGNFGLTLVRRVAEFSNSLANVSGSMDAFAIGMPNISNDACLSFMVQCSATNTGVIMGSVDLVEG